MCCWRVPALSPILLHVLLLRQPCPLPSFPLWLVMSLLLHVLLLRPSCPLPSFPLWLATSFLLHVLLLRPSCPLPSFPLWLVMSFFVLLLPGVALSVRSPCPTLAFVVLVALPRIMFLLFREIIPFFILLRPLRLLLLPRVLLLLLLLLHLLLLLLLLLLGRVLLGRLLGKSRVDRKIRFLRCCSFALLSPRRSLCSLASSVAPIHPNVLPSPGHKHRPQKLKRRLYIDYNKIKPFTRCPGPASSVSIALGSQIPGKLTQKRFIYIYMCMYTFSIYIYI